MGSQTVGHSACFIPTALDTGHGRTYGQDQTYTDLGGLPMKKRLGGLAIAVAAVIGFTSPAAAVPVKSGRRHTRLRQRHHDGRVDDVPVHRLRRNRRFRSGLRRRRRRDDAVPRLRGGPWRLVDVLLADAGNVQDHRQLLPRRRAAFHRLRLHRGGSSTDGTTPPPAPTTAAPVPTTAAPGPGPAPTTAPPGPVPTTTPALPGATTTSVVGALAPATTSGASVSGAGALPATGQDNTALLAAAGALLAIGTTLVLVRRRPA